MKKYCFVCTDYTWDGFVLFLPKGNCSGTILPKIAMRGLGKTKNYRIREINLIPDTKSRFPFNGKVFSGDFLMKVGLNVSGPDALTSSVFEILET